MKLRVSIIVFCLPIFGLGQAVEDATARLQLQDNCLLDFYSGVDKVRLGKTTIKDIFELYGETEISRKKIPFSIDMGGGYSIKTINYPWLGLAFEFSNENAKLKKRKVSKITITAPCPCKSEQGLGVGSSYEDIVNSCLGSGTYGAGEAEEFNGKLFFFNSVPEGGLILVRFLGVYQKDAFKFKGEMIELYYSKY